MARVGLNPEHYNRYPHEFSGGQRQRIGVARAIALGPKLVVCDEPVSALDVSIQAQVVNLLEDIQSEQNLAYIFIAHDLSVVRHISDRVVVMYLGKIMEDADRDELYAAPAAPLHPRAAVGGAGSRPARAQQTAQDHAARATCPRPANPPSGCVFRTRCWKAQEKCAEEVPALVELTPGHRVACHFPEPVKVPEFTRQDGMGVTGQPPSEAPEAPRGVVGEDDQRPWGGAAPEEGGDGDVLPRE